MQKRLDEIDLETNKLQEAEGIAKSNTNTNSAERAYTQKNDVKKSGRRCL